MELFKTQNFNKISELHLKFFSLKSSQNVQKLEFLEKKMFFFGKKLVFFSKTANFGKVFMNCISNCIFAQEFSKRWKVVFFLQRKVECSTYLLAKFQKQSTWLISSRICTKSFYCPRILKFFRNWPFLEKKIDHLKKKRFKTFEIA